MNNGIKSEEQIKIPNNVSIQLHIHTKNGIPAIELRRVTQDVDIIKTVINSAFNEIPIIIFPVINDRLRAINSLVNHKIIKFNYNNMTYKFLI